MAFQVKHINYPLVEDVRPPIYTAMKYWGKKPHNIWADFIRNYCPPDGVVLDPFVGSGVSAFEAARMGRRALAFDLNPLTSFMIEVLASDFDEEKFGSAVKSIESKLLRDPVYLAHYTTTYQGEDAVVHNYRWLWKEVDKVAIETSSGKKMLVPANPKDKQRAKEMQDLSAPYWYPTDKFPQTPSIKHKFISDIGGNSFQYLWTKRNLYLLSRIFHEINIEQDETLKKQLLAGFIKTLHLTCKMVVYRAPTANRDFSGSWGRADYMIRRKSMEQNPVIEFMRSCVGKQSVLSALKSAQSYLPRNTLLNNMTLNNINETRKIKPGADINYGILDIADLADYVDEKSVDFVITDPPYAGLVYYLDLSLVWLVWLQKLDMKYRPDLNAEITIKKGQIERPAYQRRFENAFKQIHRALKDDGYFVVTFHHKKTIEFDSLIRAIKDSGFKVDKVTHQYNRRTGESNVANPYGTSGSDMYVRCVKHRDVDFSDDRSALRHFVKETTIKIIAERNEETPYSFIVQGVIPEMIQGGYIQPDDYQEEVAKILNDYVGPDEIFTVRKNKDSKAGDYWWFVDPREHIKYPDRPLKDRVEENVLSILRRKIAVKFDDVLGELFQTFPNGLLPHQKDVRTVLEKYAYQSVGKWKIKEDVIQSINRHTVIIKKLAVIGRSVDDTIVFVGKREQPEYLGDGKKLGDYADITSLTILKDTYSPERLGRIEMIDLVWLLRSQGAIRCVFEVENTTDFTSAIQRASNIDKAIPKIMVIPDERKTELGQTRDPLFISSFSENNWGYITYDDVGRLFNYSMPTVELLLSYKKTLNEGQTIG
jgi:16S rRNA G966 N2-methylase RsmD